MATPQWVVLAVGVAVAAAAPFVPAASGGFLYDDRPLIADNVHVHSFGDWGRWLTHDFWDVNEEVKRFGARMIYWRPGVSASYALDWQLGLGSPTLFHLSNLAWHALASCLAFFALRRWIASPLPAVIAALIFAVHPTKVESVAWIAGRTDVLCAVAMLTASLGAARRLSGRRGGVLLEVSGTALAYATKEQATVLFAFVMIETWASLGRPAIDATVAKRLARSALPQLAVAAAYLACRAWLMPIRQPHEGTFAFSSHVKEVLETMGRYAALTFAPHDLSVQQGLMRAPGGQMAFDTSYVVLGAAYVVALACVADAARRKVPGVTMGIVFFAVTIFPTSNVVTTDMMTMLSERFLYVPMLGLCLALGSMADVATRRRERGTVALGLAGVLAVLALGFLSAQHAADFQNESRFWARELALHPTSLEALRYHVESAMKKKRFVRALDYVARAETAAAREYPQTGYEVDFIVQGVQLVLATIPDHDTRALDAVDAFLGNVAGGESSAANLDIGSLHIRMPLGGATLTKRIDKQRPRLIALRAGIKSRVSDDAEAIELAETAHASCPGCSDVGRTAAIVLGRAGTFERAEQILDAVASLAGDDAVTETRAIVRSAATSAANSESASTVAARLQLRATGLCTLEAWGRAYDVLAPAKSEIAEAPGFAIGFAELAWRAGEFGVAKGVLAKWMPPDTADLTTRGWSIKMGWVESPNGALTEEASSTPL